MVVKAGIRCQPAPMIIHLCGIIVTCRNIIFGVRVVVFDMKPRSRVISLEQDQYEHHCMTEYDLPPPPLLHLPIRHRRSEWFGGAAPRTTTARLSLEHRLVRQHAQERCPFPCLLLEPMFEPEGDEGLPDMEWALTTASTPNLAPAVSTAVLIYSEHSSIESQPSPGCHRCTAHRRVRTWHNSACHRRNGPFSCDKASMTDHIS